MINVDMFSSHCFIITCKTIDNTRLVRHETVFDYGILNNPRRKSKGNSKKKRQ